MTFFDLVAPIYEKLRSRTYKTAARLQEIVEFKPTDIVVDVGGGTGAIAKHFVGKVHSITVVDPSEKMLAECRKHPDLVCALGSGEALPAPSESADKIILVDAFHHIREQGKAIMEIKRVLKKGGLIVAVEYNPATFDGRAVKVLEKILRLGSHFHRPQSLVKLFSSQGFEVKLFDENKKDYYLVAQKH
ncbi:class I SAM-dependent methyltransferase [Acetobacteraceae bacterium]|nr:class I SAM-dependent methyltransferase [Candidatus Parcubacteria bacterium]